MPEFADMTRVGWLPSDVPCEIEAFVQTDDESSVPHFHVRQWENGAVAWEACVRFEGAEYAFLGKVKDRLPAGVAERLDAFLRGVDPQSRHAQTYWESAIDAWNRNNEAALLPFDLPQPDYTELA